MADESQSQEKTEDATPKRLREARKKGQVSKSRDLNTVIILIAAFGLLAVMIPYLVDLFEKLFVASFQFASQKNIPHDRLFQFLNEAVMTLIKASVPFMLGLVIVAVAVGFFQIGAIFSTEPLKPQMKRINIIENVKNMFKMTTFIELIKNVFKIGIIFYLAYSVIKTNLSQLLMTVLGDLSQTTQVGSVILTQFLFRVFVVFALLAIVDVMIQRWQYKKQLRMSKDEVKREYKQDEGDPIIRSVRKQLHQELAMGDTKQAVSASDVVITNPTHVAVAVKYNDKEMMAPQIMAKGQRWFAQQIREFAEGASVPIVQNPPLAWGLVDLDVGDEIPEELYQAVAEVLVYVQRMKEGKRGNDK